jgi:hypothetical protein
VSIVLAADIIEAVEVIWPILGGLVMVAIAYAKLGTGVKAAQSTADKAEAKADSALAGQNGIRIELTRITTILEERLPAKVG